jgi:hypothetical protein
MFMCAAMTTTDIDLALDAAEASFKVLKGRLSELEPVEKMRFLVA